MDGEATVIRVWERREDESEPAFTAFCIYRDMGGQRDYSKAYREYLRTKRGPKEAHVEGVRGISGLWKKWKEKFNWRERALAYDRHVDQLIREKLEAGLMEMKERHVRLAMAVQGKAIEGLQAISGKELTMGQIVFALNSAVDMERTSRGEGRKSAGEVRRAIILPSNNRDTEADEDLGPDHPGSE